MNKVILINGNEKRKLDGHITRDEGTFTFSSMIVGPLTNVNIYKGIDTLFTIHNGHNDEVHVDGLGNLVDVNITVTDAIGDGRGYTKNVVNGAVKPLKPSNSRMKLLVMVLMIVIVYYVFVRLWQTKVISVMMKRFSGHVYN